MADKIWTWDQEGNISYKDTTVKFTDLVELIPTLDILGKVIGEIVKQNQVTKLWTGEMDVTTNTELDIPGDISGYKVITVIVQYHLIGQDPLEGCFVSRTKVYLTTDTNDKSQYIDGNLNVAYSVNMGTNKLHWDTEMDAGNTATIIGLEGSMQ